MFLLRRSTIATAALVLGVLFGIKIERLVRADICLDAGGRVNEQRLCEGLPAR